MTSRERLARLYAHADATRCLERVFTNRRACPCARCVAWRRDFDARATAREQAIVTHRRALAQRRRRAP